MAADKAFSPVLDSIEWTVQHLKCHLCHTSGVHHRLLSDCLCGQPDDGRDVQPCGRHHWLRNSDLFATCGHAPSNWSMAGGSGSGWLHQGLRSVLDGHCQPTIAQARANHARAACLGSPKPDRVGHFVSLPPISLCMPPGPVLLNFHITLFWSSLSSSVVR